MRLSELYPLFERVIAAALLVGMIFVVILSAISFGQSLVEIAISKLNEPMSYQNLQLLFGKVLAALIALELAHSVHQTATGKHGLIQVKTIIVIGVLAVVRKLIPLDFERQPEMLYGLAAAILALGILFALINYVEERRGGDAVPMAPGDVD